MMPETLTIQENLLKKLPLLDMAYLEAADYYLSGFSKKFILSSENILTNDRWLQTLHYLKEVLKYYKRIEVLDAHEINFVKIFTSEKILMQRKWNKFPLHIQQSIEKFSIFLDDNKDLFD